MAFVLFVQPCILAVTSALSCLEATKVRYSMSCSGARERANRYGVVREPWKYWSVPAMHYGSDALNWRASDSLEATQNKVGCSALGANR